MWSAIGHILLRFRIQFLVGLIAATGVMGYFATKIELSYTYARALPTDDTAYINYEKFKSLYGGEDGNVMFIGFADKNLFQLKKFNEWYDLAEKIKAKEGIKDVLSIGKLFKIERNDSLMKFEFLPIIKKKPETQAELDSIRDVIYNYPFYEGLAYARESGATVMAITFTQQLLNSKDRIETVRDITALGDEFAKSNNIDIHYSGLPYIRTEYMKMVAGEMKLFLILALLITTIILGIFFRYFNAVFFSLIVVIMGMVWSLGTLYLFGYKITILTGLIAPLITIIGVPNCIFLINKYQEELLIHGNKIKALSRVVAKVGLSNFLANVTTAIGFFVFYFTNSTLLVEFGILAAVNVIITYVIAHIFIPVIFSYLPAPSPKHSKHLQGKRVNFILDWVDKIVHHHRRLIYLIIIAVTGISIYGMTKIKIIGYVVDDLPKEHILYTHLKFFENNFNGIVPFDINIDTKKDNGVFSENGKTLYKIKAFQKSMSGMEELSKPLSIVEGLKFAYQSYKNGNPKFYILPGATELKKLSEYTNSVKGQENKLSAFLDTTRRYTRVSYQMKDIGSVKMKELIEKVQPKIDSIFPKNEFDVAITGFSPVFLKSNDYLFHHLFISLLIAIGLILLIGMVLFRSIAIIVLSKIPCLIPLALTAGIMGFMDIPFKPSTILIFSIAFGIASDGTIYILTEYRTQLLRRTHGNRSKAISATIRDTGLSMIYTAIILAFGFSIFAASSFGGTKALGILISITLLVSLLTNLILLPCILLSLERKSILKAFKKEPLIQLLDEEEDIDHVKLEIHKGHHQKKDDDSNKKS